MVKKGGWSASDGELEDKKIAGYIRSRKQIIWTAPLDPKTVTIEARPLRKKFQSCAKTFKVIAPTTINYHDAEAAWPQDRGAFKGPVGAGMSIQMTVLPSHANFGRVEYQELGGAKEGQPAGLTGFFASHVKKLAKEVDEGTKPPSVKEAYQHNPHPGFTNVFRDNSAGTDYALIDLQNTPNPGEAGRFHWNIPIAYARGKRFTGASTQSFELKPDRSVTIEKKGSLGGGVKITRAEGNSPPG